MGTVEQVCGSPDHRLRGPFASANVARRVRFGWLAPLVGVLQACGMACTLVGCSSGLELVFNRTPGTDAVLTLDLGDGVPWVVDCSEQVCGARVRFSSLIVDAARVVVVEGGDTTEFAIQPLYRRIHPNGPDCEPTCRVAEVSLVLP